MEKPIYVRILTEQEKEHIKEGLKSKKAFEMRRSQIIMASSKAKGVKEIAEEIGCSGGTVRNTINAFNKEGVECIKKKSCRPKKLQTIFDIEKCEKLREILHESPRKYGKETSLWTLKLAAIVMYEKGLTAKQVSIETIRLALKKLKISWERAKNWITSPDPKYRIKKSKEIG